MLSTLLAVLDFLQPEKLLSSGGYVLLFAIVFAESGLLVGFFLPGDSLLFTAGAVAAGAFDQVGGLRNLDFNIAVLSVGCAIAAVAGDQAGYVIGRRAGPRLFNRPDSRFFKQEFVEKGERFFEGYGPKAIILARFVPVVRTFVPTIAGASKMDYPTFLRFNLIGGVVWGGGVTLLGYGFGNIDVVKENFELAIFGVIAISLLPIVVEVLKHRRQRAAR